MPAVATRIMYIENKGQGLTGPARIGRVAFSKSGATLRYRDLTFRSLRGAGFKANYRCVETGEHYWISGPKKRGGDSLYATNIAPEVDDDVAEEYWTVIRGRAAPPAARRKPVAGAAPATAAKRR